jgi:hypothetical protein
MFIGVSWELLCLPGTAPCGLVDPTAVGRRRRRFFVRTRGARVRIAVCSGIEFRNTRAAARRRCHAATMESVADAASSRDPPQRSDARAHRSTRASKSCNTLKKPQSSAPR